MTEKEIYAKKQKEWVESNDIKPGDKVKVLCKAVEGERGWDNSWELEMDEAVGKSFEVERIDDKEGVVLVCSGEFLVDYGFPFFVLEKVG